MSSSPKNTREALLEAAAELLKRRGARATLDEVADAANVSRQTVYLHFGSRTGLMLALVQHIDSRGTLQRLIERIFDAPTAVSALDAVVALHAEYYPLIYPVAQVLMARRQDDEAMAAAWDDRMESRRMLYREVVRRLADEALLAPEWEIEDATDVLWALTSWEVWEQLTRTRGRSSDDYVRLLSTIIKRTLVGSAAAG
ncbi:MAG: TetR/AcrR family transcriptional regulator [Actinomycetota bacterium]|nr:TetR/AcrR family transcriptional regulator [Actinomycetota bacterium]